LKGKLSLLQSHFVYISTVPSNLWIAWLLSIH